MNKTPTPSSQLCLDLLGWTSTFENRRCLCINLPMAPQDFEQSTFSTHPIIVTYMHDGEQFIISLYSALASGIDVGEIARQRGGAGGRNTAKFLCKTLPMIKEAAYVTR